MTNNPKPPADPIVEQRHRDAEKAMSDACWQAMVDGTATTPEQIAEIRAQALACFERDLTHPAPAKLREAIIAEVQRQCKIGAGRASIDPSCGLFQVEADLDINTLARVLAALQSTPDTQAIVAETIERCAKLAEVEGDKHPSANLAWMRREVAACIACDIRALKPSDGEGGSNG